MKVFGLTGGIATGKSTVAHLLRLRGVPVVDADASARAVVEPGSPVLAAIVDALGPEVLTEDGQLDRPAVRARIASDPDARATLEALTHPAIRAHIQDQLRALESDGHPTAVVEAALMVETGSYHNYDKLIVVSCNEATQLNRALSRDGSDEATIRGLISAQLPLSDKEAVADVVIGNDGSLDDLAAAVRRVWNELD